MISFSKLKTIDFSYVGIIVLAAALYVGFDDLILSSASETVRETLNAAIGVIFVIITTMYMLKKQAEVEQTKALGKEVFTKKLATYEKAIETWEHICFSQTPVSENQFATAVNVHTSLCMIAPADVVVTSGEIIKLINVVYINGNKQQSRAFAPAEKNNMCNYLGVFSEAVRKDLSLPKTEMTKDFQDSFTGLFTELGKTATTSRDTTRYTFKGESSGKGRLVLAVVKSVAEDRKIENIDQLKKLFPDEDWNKGKSSNSKNAFVVELEAEAKKNGARYFSKPGDLISLKDGSLVVVNNQWGDDNFSYLLERLPTEIRAKIQRVVG